MRIHDHSKHLVHRLVEIVNERDFDSIDEVATGQIASEARRWVGPFRDSFPDFHMEVIDVIADQNLLLLRGSVPGPKGGTVEIRTDS